MYRPSSALQSLCLVLPLQVCVEDLLVQRDLLVAPGGAVQTLVVLRRLREIIYRVIPDLTIGPNMQFCRSAKRERSVTKKTCVGVH